MSKPTARLGKGLSALITPRAPVSQPTVARGSEPATTLREGFDLTRDSLERLRRRAITQLANIEPRAFSARDCTTCAGRRVHSSRANGGFVPRNWPA